MIGKLHKAVPILFRCPKIRKSKSACVKFSQSDVYVLNSRQLWHDDVHGTLRLFLPSMAEKYYTLTDRLRFTNFLPKSKKQSMLCAICQLLGCEPPFDTRILKSDKDRHIFIDFLLRS